MKGSVMSGSKKKKNLVWIDMEMTGLDPRKDKIIEIATIITDGDLNLVAEGPAMVLHLPESRLKKMDEWNREHHQKSGLWESVVKSKVNLQEAERLTLEFIREHCVEKKSPLCGNSIHHDRRFLAEHMPSIEQYLHYRIIDVSTVKDLVKRWYPKTTKKAPKKQENHRALDDIRESIEELKFYRKTFFRGKVS